MTRSTKDDFHFESRLGSGTFGVVWRAVRKLDGKPYAIKELDLRYMNKKVDCSVQQLQALDYASSCSAVAFPWLRAPIGSAGAGGVHQGSSDPGFAGLPLRDPLL